VLTIDGGKSACKRRLETERKRWSKNIKEIHKTSYFCREDAYAAVVRLQKESLEYHRIELTVVEQPRYARGRPKADGTRALKHMHFGISAQLTEKAEAIATMREEAGCFVVISNVPPTGPPNAQLPTMAR